MKSLKKTLSLVLVLVMVLGMFGSSFAAFTDAKTIQYTEAVEVMTGIGAIAGYPEGDFRPAGTITRAEAAKMVAYTVLGKTVADNLRAQDSSFADVGADLAWAVPSIEYLKSINVINGISATQFNPNGNVTALELAKMLLVALGYGVNGEYVGSGWDLAVAVDASKPDSAFFTVFGGRKAGASELSAAATREEAALYCFNMINKVLVAYTKDKNIYEERSSLVLGTTVPLTFRNNLYGTRLDVDYALSDDLGRPITTWTYINKVICSAPQTPVLTFTTALKAKELAVLASNAGYSFDAASATGELELFTNGSPLLLDNTDYLTALGANTQLTGNGTLLELYVNVAGKIDRIVAIATYLSEVVAFAKDNPATTNVDERTITVDADGIGFNNIITSSTPGFAAAYDAAVAAYNADKPCYLLVTPDYDGTVSTRTGVHSVAVPEALTITPTAWNAVSVTAGGKTYGYSQHNNTLPVTSVGAPTAIMLDTYGYIIFTDAIPQTANALLIATTQQQDPGTWAVSYKARLLNPDGTTKDVLIDQADLNIAPGTVVAATPGPGGIHTIVELSAPANEIDGALSLKSGTASFTWDSNTIKTNTKTVFFVRSGSIGAYTYAAYVGYAAVPTLTGTAAAEGNVIYTDASGVATFVYITNATPATSAGSYIFLPEAIPASSKGEDSNGEFWTVEVFVDGATVEMKLNTDTYAPGVYASKYENAFGVVTLSTPTALNTYAAGAYANGWLTLDATTSYALTPSCKVYVSNATGINPIKVSELVVDATTNLTYVLNADNQVATIFIAA